MNIDDSLSLIPKIATSDAKIHYPMPVVAQCSQVQPLPF